MNNITVAFLATGVVLVLAGVVLGIWVSELPYRDRAAWHRFLVVILLSMGGASWIAAAWVQALA